MALEGHEGEQTGHGWTLSLGAFDDDFVSMDPPETAFEDIEFTDVGDAQKITLPSIPDNGELTVVYNYTDDRYATLMGLAGDLITSILKTSTGLTCTWANSYIKGVKKTSISNNEPTQIEVKVKVNTLVVTNN